MPIVLPSFAQSQSLSFTANPTVEPGAQSPLWWVYRLSQRLSREIVGNIERTPDGVMVLREGLARLDRYYDGQFDLPWVRDDAVKAEYLSLLHRSRSNFLRLVVNACAERSTVQGLRLPGDDEAADSETWDIVLRNGLDHWLPVAFRAALVQRRSFLSVWYDGDRARIAVEDPQQAIVEYVPGDRSRRAAGLKLWVDDWTTEQHADLFMTDAIHHFRWGRGAGGLMGWYERRESTPNPLGVVTLVPLVNQPQMRRDGVSELEDLIPVQDRINQTLFNRQIAEHLTAFRQKWATGMEIPVDPESGEPVQSYVAAINSIWLADNPQAKFGQFDATDLANYHKTIEQDLEHLSVMSRTPRHVFMHQGQAPSGDAMKSDEAGLVAKVKGNWKSFGSSIREALALARRIEGHETPLASELVWADPEFQTFAQLVDGHVKLLGERVTSLKYVREKVGMSPATMRRVELEVAQEQLFSFVESGDA